MTITQDANSNAQVSGSDPVGMIPLGDEYMELRAMLKILKRDFPDDYAGLVNQPDRIQGWIDEIDSGGRTADDIRDDIVKYIITEEVLIERYGVSEEEAAQLVLGGNEGGMNFSELSDEQLEYGQNLENPPLEEGGEREEEDIAEGGVGSTDLTILTGKEMKWYFDPASGKWYVEYGLPNSDKTVVFEADPDQMDSLFGEGVRPANYQDISFAELVANNEDAVFAGNISEMEGTGAFEDEVQKVISLALDNGELPSWLKDSDAALDILYIAQTENKSNEWVMEQFSALPEFQARFPGIDTLKKDGNLTLAEAVSSFLEYEATLKQASKALGGTAEDITPEIVGGLINQGYSVKAATDIMQTYDRIQKSGPALEAFNAILVANGMDPITDAQDVYDFMEGYAPTEVYELYEASSVQEAANLAGLGDIFDADRAIDAALEGTFNIQNATIAMQKAAKLLLRMRGSIDLNQFDLEVDDLIDMSLGLAAKSGRSEAEIFDNVNRATLTAQANLQGRSNPFASFTEQGVKQNTSLGALRSQS